MQTTESKVKQDLEENNSTDVDMEVKESRDRGHEKSGNKKLSDVDTYINIQNQLDGT